MPGTVLEAWDMLVNSQAWDMLVNSQISKNPCPPPPHPSVNIFLGEGQVGSLDNQNHSK